MKMSYNPESPKLDLKLNLSPPRESQQVQSPNKQASSIEISPRSSCVSRDVSPDDNLPYTSSPKSSSMILVGCPQCLMYVMLSAEDPKCPKCKSTVLLDFLHEDGVKKFKN